MADSSPPNSGADSGSLPREPEPLTDAPTLDASPLLFRRYRVERELGRGGMGQVMLAHDTALGILVAVKLVSEVVAKDTDAVSDLRKEVLRGMALMHPGIVRTHNFERDEAGAAIVMEYVEGDTLSDLKAGQPGGCFDPAQILPWLEQLCAVLDYAHRDARIVHRDLKPRNVMLTREGRIKVADFGISATLSDSQSRHSMEGVNSGTPPYMSPQQAQGKRPTALDDVYALGATIYELLTGKPPFFRGNILMQVLGETAPSMTERREEFEMRDRTAIPPAWEAAIAACLAKDPAQRPASAGEVLLRLKDEIRAGSETATQVPTLRVELPVSAAAIPADETRTLPESRQPPPAPVPPTFPVHPATRRSLWPWAAGMLLLALAVGAGVYFRDGTRRDANQAPLASTPGRNAAAPDASQLLAEARALRENEAYLLARERLQAALALEPANSAVLTELAAVKALLAPAAGNAPTASEPPATPASAIPTASVALIRRLTGSSTLQSQVDNAGHRNFYEAGNAIDGKVNTAWVAARGAKDVWLRVEFERDVTVSRFVLFPGYGKDADAFAKNNRVKAFALEFPGGRAFQFSCADRRASQTFILPEPVTSATLVFRVLEVYRAETYGGDTPISEIGF